VRTSHWRIPVWSHCWTNESPCPKLETSAHWYKNWWCICYYWLCTRSMHLTDKFLGSFLQIWCGEQQLDLIVKQAFNELMDEKFLKILTGVTSMFHCLIIWTVLEPTWKWVWRPAKFCGAIASIMPGTSRIESDLSLINWTKDSSSQSLHDFSLE